MPCATAVEATEAAAVEDAVEAAPEAEGALSGRATPNVGPMRWRKRRARTARTRASALSIKEQRSP